MEVIRRSDSHPLQSPRLVDLEESHQRPQLQPELPPPPQQLETHPSQQSPSATRGPHTPGSEENSQISNMLSSRSPSAGSRTEQSRHTPLSSPAVHLESHAQNPPQIDGQRHERMETDDEESENTASGSETPGPSHNRSNVSSSAPEESPDGTEPMDTSLDGVDLVAQGTGFPTAANNLQMLMDEQVAMAMGHEGLIRITAGGGIDEARGISAAEQEAALHAILNTSSNPDAAPASTSEGPTDATPSSGHASEAPTDEAPSRTANPIDQSSGATQGNAPTQQNDGAVAGDADQAAGNDHNAAGVREPLTVPPQSATADAPAATDDDARGDPTAENDDDGDSSDDEEHPYWADYKQDTSAPDAGELKEMEGSQEPDALDHDHWQTKIFEPLEDPEFAPDDVGRIQWTLKGVHGTPEKPNRESILVSPTVQIGGFFWHIKFFPRGNEQTDMMSLYIECSDQPQAENEIGKGDRESTHAASSIPGTSPRDQETSARSESGTSAQGSSSPKRTDSVATESSTMSNFRSWEVPAQIGCVVYNPSETSVYVQRRSCHRFHHETEDWGWTRFTGPWTEMHQRKQCERKPLLQDDTISFTAYIRTFKDHTGSLWWHPPNDREWDSHERFGIRSFQSGILSPSALPAAMSALVHLRPFTLPLTRSVRSRSNSSMRHRPREVTFTAFSISGAVSRADEYSSEIPLGHLAEALRWHCQDIGKMDVVELWEILRTLLSVEAAGLQPGSDASDIFPGLAMIRQPDRIALSKGHKLGDVKSATAIREPHSVQQVLDSIQTLQSVSGEAPPILMVELHRQEYLQNCRRWKKLTHRIGLCRTVKVSFGGEGDKKDQKYSLFGMVVHSGGLESKHYSTVIQPEGPGTRWIKYGSMFDEKKAECLTNKQVFERYEGMDGADENTAVAYIAMYALSDQLTKIFEKVAPPANIPVVSAIVDTSKEVQKDQEHNDKKRASQDSAGSKHKVEPITMTIYDSEMFNTYSGRGMLDPWSPHMGDEEAADNKILEMEVTSEEGIKGTDDRVLEALKAKNPDEEHQFSLFGLDYDPKYFLRGPVPFLSYHSIKALENPTSKLHGCRLWLHRLSSEERSIVDQVRSQRKRQKLSHAKAKPPTEPAPTGTATETSNIVTTIQSDGESGDQSAPSAQNDVAQQNRESTSETGAGIQDLASAPTSFDFSILLPESAGNAAAGQAFVAESPSLPPPDSVTITAEAAEATASIHTIDERNARLAPAEAVAEMEEPQPEAAASSISVETPAIATNETVPDGDDIEVVSNAQAADTLAQIASIPTTEAVGESVHANTSDASNGAIIDEGTVEVGANAEPSAVPATDSPEHPEVSGASEDVVMGGTQEASESAAPLCTTDEEPKDGPECSEDLQEHTYILVKRFNPYDQSLKGISSFYCKKSDEIINAIRQKLSMDKNAKAIDVYQERALLPTAEDRINDSFTFNDLFDRSQGRIFVIQDRLSNDEITSLTQSGLPPTIPLYFSTLLALENPAHRTPHYTRHYFSSPYLSTPQSHSLPHGSPATFISLSGDHYTGPFTLGTKSGANGTFVSASSGDTYTGAFENDLFHGQGTIHYARSGNVYEGGWKRGKWFGKGTMRFERAEAEARECAICWEEEMTTAVTPCGHLVACEACARQVEQCPVCRRGVSGLLRVWVS